MARWRSHCMGYHHHLLLGQPRIIDLNQASWYSCSPELVKRNGTYTMPVSRKGTIYIYSGGCQPALQMRYGSFKRQEVFLQKTLLNMGSLLRVQS